MMLGGATTGAIVASSGVELRAPHGGIFVFFAITGLLMFVLAIIAGTVVGALGHRRQEHRPAEGRGRPRGRRRPGALAQPGPGARGGSLSGKLTTTRAQ